MNYASFFYTFDDLPPSPTVAQIRRKINSGPRRQYAFTHFCNEHPDSIEYRLGYVESYAENGVYDDGQYKHCFDWISQSLSLPDNNGVHDKLRKLQADLANQQRQMHAEIGPDPDVNRDPLDVAFKSGDYGIIESEFSSLQGAITPKGILGGADEKLFWRLFQMIIRIAFKRGEPQSAMSHLAEYEKQRIAVRLTPIPDFDLQELVLGYLAQQSVDSARSHLQRWLSNSRMPIINDTIKQHDAFRDLCS